MKKRIVVTQRDINNGVRQASNLCPIALAATRAFGTPMHFTGLDVHSQGACFGDGPDDIRAPAPARADHWMRDFDARLPVRPFQFTVEYNL